MSEVAERAAAAGAADGVVFATSLDARAQAYWGLSPKMLARFQGRLLAVLVEQQLRGVTNMSAKELREAYSRATGVWVDMSSISSTVNGLVAAGRVERLPGLRPCSITGREISPIRAVPQQRGLV